MWESNRRLLVRNTGEYIIVDERDWDTVCHIVWRLDGEKIVAPNGKTYETVCKFPQDMVNRHDNIYDKIRQRLIPAGKKWVFSEFHGGFIIK